MGNWRGAAALLGGGSKRRGEFIASIRRLDLLFPFAVSIRCFNPMFRSAVSIRCFDPLFRLAGPFAVSIGRLYCPFRFAV
jgi:hypothetical protein